MADNLFIFACRQKANHYLDKRQASAAILRHDAAEISEMPYRMRALSACRSRRKQKSICSVVRRGDKGYAWPTCWSDMMADISPRHFSVG